MPYCLVCGDKVKNKFCSRSCYYEAQGTGLSPNPGRFEVGVPIPRTVRRKQAATMRRKYKENHSYLSKFILAGRDPEVRARAKASQQGQNKGNIAWNRGLTKYTSESVARHAKFLKELHASPDSPWDDEYRAVVSKRQTENNSRAGWFQKATKKERMEWIRSMRGGQAVRPTKPEKIAKRIIKKFDLPYKYVGDGKFWISSMNPDFVNVNGDKIVLEVFGDYWHTLPDVVRKDQIKKKMLRSYGWDRIVIWENELNNLSDNKIASIISGGPSFLREVKLYANE